VDRHEAMLRELNLYPQWVRKNQPVPVSAEQSALSNLPSVEANPGPGQSIAAKIEMITPPAETVSNVPVESVVIDQIQASSSSVGNLDWTALKQQVRDCKSCKLRAGCTQTVFGVGDEQADWLFVGEGPGADEDALGEPFVGQAGKLLDNMLMAIKLKRGKNVYIANVVKCRPPGNRTPEADEIAACMPYLRRQIELIQPKLIVALGKVASNALLGRDATLASLRGKLHEYRVALPSDLRSTSSAIPLIVTYHPAYLLRSPSEKSKAWQDLLMAVQTSNSQR